jgi:hypothetical protein
MGDFQVTRSTRTLDHHEHITELGTDTWTRTVAGIISLIEKGDTFYTLVNGHRAEILPRQGAHRKYVQTKADGVWSNNLLALQPCIVAAA